MGFVGGIGGIRPGFVGNMVRLGISGFIGIITGKSCTVLISSGFIGSGFIGSLTGKSCTVLEGPIVNPGMVVGILGTGIGAIVGILGTGIGAIVGILGTGIMGAGIGAIVGIMGADIGDEGAIANLGI
jgi:hypothetical protein